MSLPFDIVAAADEGNGLGHKGDIPWHLPGDLKFLKRLTSDTQDAGKQNAVVMGRITWETIPARFQPLPNRLNGVITRNRQYSVPDNVLMAHSLEQMLAQLKEREDVETVFVLGGGQIYRQAVEMAECRRIYLTRVHQRYECDAFFPAVDASVYHLAEASKRHEHKGVGYVFQTWERRA